MRIVNLDEAFVLVLQAFGNMLELANSPTKPFITQYTGLAKAIGVELEELHLPYNEKVNAFLWEAFCQGSSFSKDKTVLHQLLQVLHVNVIAKIGYDIPANTLVSYGDLHKDVVSEEVLALTKTNYSYGVVSELRIVGNFCRNLTASDLVLSVDRHVRPFQLLSPIPLLQASTTNRGMPFNLQVESE